MSERKEKVANYLKELTAEFLGRENNRTSLITVTSATCSPDLKRATIFITVFPIEKEKTALEFAKRKRGELREFLKKVMTTKNIPFIDIAIDLGEKHRQKIDELLRENNKALNLRPGAELNRRIFLLQRNALPLGYQAIYIFIYTKRFVYYNLCTEE